MRMQLCHHYCSVSYSIEVFRTSPITPPTSSSVGGFFATFHFAVSFCGTFLLVRGLGCSWPRASRWRNTAATAYYATIPNDNVDEGDSLAPVEA